MHKSCWINANDRPMFHCMWGMLASLCFSIYSQLWLIFVLVQILGQHELAICFLCSLLNLAPLVFSKLQVWWGQGKRIWTITCAWIGGALVLTSFPIAFPSSSPNMNLDILHVQDWAWTWKSIQKSGVLNLETKLHHLRCTEGFIFYYLGSSNLQAWELKLKVMCGYFIESDQMCWFWLCKSM